MWAKNANGFFNGIIKEWPLQSFFLYSSHSLSFTNTHTHCHWEEERERDVSIFSFLRKITVFDIKGGGREMIVSHVKKICRSCKEGNCSTHSSSGGSLAGLIICLENLAEFDSAWVLFISRGPRPSPFSSSSQQEFQFQCVCVCVWERERKDDNIEREEEEEGETMCLIRVCLFIYPVIHQTVEGGGLRSSGAQKATKYDQPRAASSSWTSINTMSTLTFSQFQGCTG